MDADLQKCAASCSELEAIEKLTAFEGERYLLSPDKDISEAQISQVAGKSHRPNLRLHGGLVLERERLYRILALCHCPKGTSRH